MGLRASIVLLDREFYSVDVIAVLHKQNIKFLMLAVRNSGIKKAVDDHRAGNRKAVSEYTVTNKDGETFTFTLFIHKFKLDNKDKNDKKKKYKYVAFATNAPPRVEADLIHLVKLYGKRWGIETGYRQLEKLRPWTCSQNPAFRMFLIVVSVYAQHVGHEALQTGSAISQVHRV